MLDGSANSGNRRWQIWFRFCNVTGYGMPLWTCLRGPPDRASHLAACGVIDLADLLLDILDELA